MKGLITRNLHVKYESPTTYSSRDIAQVNILSTDNAAAAEGMALALGTIVPAS